MSYVGSVVYRLCFRFILRLVTQPSYPQIISGQWERRADQCGKECNPACEQSAPAADMNGVDRAAHVRRLVLTGVWRASREFSVFRIEVEAVARTETVASRGDNTCRTVGEGYLAIARMEFCQLFVDVLPMSERCGLCRDGDCGRILADSGCINRRPCFSYGRLGGVSLSFTDVSVPSVLMCVTWAV